MQSNLFIQLSLLSCMTKSFFFLIGIALLVAGTCIAGCTTPVTAAPPSPAATAATPAAASGAAVPDLTGIWTGTTVGHTKIEGFVEYPVATYNISAQKGRAYTGQKEYPRMDKKTYTEGFSGIVTRNNEIFIGDHMSGYIEGRLTGPDTMELFYIDHGPDAKAFIIELARKKS
jgi:hypothetical protein